MPSKKCPFCAELIQDEAIKCRYCNEWLDGRVVQQQTANIQGPKRLWCFSTSFIVFSMLLVGPLALPLVWFNPQYKLSTKITVTVVVAIITLLCVQLLRQAIPAIMAEKEELQKLMDQLGGSLPIR